MGELVHVFGRDILAISGGAKSYLCAQCMAASSAGYRPHVFVASKVRGQVDLGYATVHRVATLRPNSRVEYAFVRNRRLGREIFEFLRDRDGPHVIHSYGPWAGAALNARGRLAAAGVEAEVVTTCFEIHECSARAKLHNRIVRRHPWLFIQTAFEYGLTRVVTRRIERRVYEQSVVVVNYDVVRRLLVRFGGNRLRIEKLPYAAPSAFEPRLDDSPLPVDVMKLRKQNGPLIVTTSRQAPRKGLDTLIRALARLRDDDVEFRAVLIGKGNLLRAHRRLVAELKLDDRVSLPGLVSDVRPYLDHADVFVLPSIAEGCGSMAVLEALRAGLAVISTDVDGMPEDITDGVDGVLVGAGSVDELVRGLRPMLTDAALRKQLGAAARELHERRFSVEGAVDALRDFYTALGLAPESAVATRPARAIASPTRAMSDSVSVGADGR